jgi:XTP/dITP diphosphohydrolase
MSMDIVLATRNKKKVVEIGRILRGLPVTVLSLAEFEACPETIEDQPTFEGNAVKKAVDVCNCTNRPSLADDSGLEVEALNGAPGVFSARYAGASGKDCDQLNYEKLLRELKDTPLESRRARFVCCLAFARPGVDTVTFFGFVNGHISLQPRGKTGFGYDPVFIPDGYGKTFAEMSAEEKDSLSHRGKAIEKFYQFVASQPLL